MQTNRINEIQAKLESLENEIDQATMSDDEARMTTLSAEYDLLAEELMKLEAGE